jgi:hypothetical protein
MTQHPLDSQLVGTERKKRDKDRKLKIKKQNHSMKEKQDADQGKASRASRWSAPRAVGSQSERRLGGRVASLPASRLILQ